jgi:hypothetical protein
MAGIAGLSVHNIMTIQTAERFRPFRAAVRKDASASPSLWERILY